GNLIHGITRKNQVDRFKDELIEDSLFTIKNFKIVESIGGYRPVEYSLTLIFTASSVIKNLSKDIVHIPTNGFQFIKLAMIDSRMDNDNVLSDVVSCLYGIGEMVNLGSRWKKGDIQIFTD
ncbi:hypothetical protein HAX54_001225, partial [Datura stramonium]|nr:hypothetical protein [Datura stramonium]